MQQYIIDAVVACAERHEAKHGDPATFTSDTPYLLKIAEELNELCDALLGTHEHPPGLELMQIASLCMNWLQARGTTWVQMIDIEDIEYAKHGMYRASGEEG